MNDNSRVYQDASTSAEDAVDNTDHFKSLRSQVGGHVNMKILNEAYVCKPLNSREVRFYQKLPSQLQDFVPNYHGTFSENYYVSSRR